MKYLAFVAIFLVGCSKSYVIDSEPSGARVIIDGEYKGITPVKTKSRCTTFGDKPFFRIEKDELKEVGYLPYETSWLNVGLDMIFFWPMLFVNIDCPKDSYRFSLT